MLEVNDLHAYYGKSHILNGVNFSMKEGEVVALLGRNGVGRSTTVKAIMGEVPPQGSVRFRGEEIAGLPNHRIARKGLGYVPERRDIFRRSRCARTWSWASRTPASRGPGKCSSFSTCSPTWRGAPTPAGVLSGGEKQMLTISRTLMGDPKLIMIDEPTEGLAPLIVKQIGELISEIARAGVSILLVEQKLSIAMDISHRVLVMGHGRIVFEGTPAALRDDEAVRREWLEV